MFGEGHFPERPSLGDFTEGCFGVLGQVGNYPQGNFSGDISSRNHPPIDWCASITLCFNKSRQRRWTTAGLGLETIRY